jgi:hypothetical protein
MNGDSAILQKSPQNPRHVSKSAKRTRNLTVCWCWMRFAGGGHAVSKTDQRGPTCVVAGPDPPCAHQYLPRPFVLCL